MLRQSHPLIRPVGERLVLPDGNARFELVDQPTRRAERLVAMGRGGGHDDGEVPYRQVTDPVMSGQSRLGEQVGHLGGHPVKGCQRLRVRGVVEGGHSLLGLSVVVADRADEQDEPARRWVAHRPDDGVHGQRFVHDRDLRGDQAVHAAEPTPLRHQRSRDAVGGDAGYRGMVSDLPFGFGPPDPDRDPDDSGTPADPFSAMLGGMGAADLGAALQRFGQLLSTSSGPVHWDLARDTARQVVAAEGDPSVTPAERAAVIEAVALADLWLEDATALPSATTSVEAWSRAEWIEQTLPRWKTLIAPLAERMSAATSESLPGQMPEEMRAMAGPLMGVMSQMSGVMFGGQVGQGLGALAQEVLSSTDVGVPLTSAGIVALVPRNIAAFGEGLGIPDDQVRLALALRECAHVRLFHHAPWLAGHIEAAVADYARGIAVDVGAIESALGGIDPSRPEAIAELMSSGVFEPPTTPEQQAALDRLEVLLALIEGWVDEVTALAAADRLPAFDALRETMRRRRATGGPAERTFETLVGLQLRPRRLRDAAALWRHLASERSQTDRDAVWDHPDLLPDAADLDDPVAFVARSTGVLDLSGLDDTPPPAEPAADDDAG